MSSTCNFIKGKCRIRQNQRYDTYSSSNLSRRSHAEIIYSTVWVFVTILDIWIAIESWRLLRMIIFYMLYLDK